MHKLALFDIDGTVFRSSLLISLVKALVREGVFPSTSFRRAEDSEERWRARSGTYHTYISDVIRTFMDNIQGVHYGVLRDIGRNVVRYEGRHVYRYTRNLIESLRSDGYTLIALSQSPKVILDEFCALYGFHKVYGRIYEIGPRDLFTGHVIDEDIIQDKSNIVERILESGEWSLTHSVGVGDTEGDISFLSMVDRPICFNPNQELYTHARKAGWRVVVERKDVIYEL